MNVSSLQVEPKKLESKELSRLCNLSRRCLSHKKYIPVRRRLVRRRIYALEHNERGDLSFMVQSIDLFLDVSFICKSLLTLCKFLP
jgi:hypothetical protein